MSAIGPYIPIYRVQDDLIPPEIRALKTRPYDGSGCKPHFWHITSIAKLKR